MMHMPLFSNPKIREILESVLEEYAEEAIAGVPFTELKCWDSMRYVLLVVSVQSTFEVELDESQIVKITTLIGMCEVLKEHGVSP
ncbi:MAG: acyl carrier protein [Desulfobacteraceae bacterium]|nr:MAG: acyl carrier protein [Desulfobacteraceae bacterium]